MSKTRFINHRPFGYFRFSIYNTNFILCYSEKSETGENLWRKHEES